MLEQHSYLLQNQVNPFPISGQLVLDDDERLSFTLDASAAEAFLGWLETSLQTNGLKDRIEAGERPVAFDLPVANRKIGWPMSLGGYGMKIEDDQRKWVVALLYPSGGISQLVNLMKARGTARPWKDAFRAAGAA